MAQALVAPSIDAQGSADPSAASWPSPARAWYAVAIFGATVFTLFGNQFLVALMIEPIRLDTHLTDNQVALIFGGASGFVLAFASLVVSPLADIYSRRLIIEIGRASCRERV